MDLRAAKGKRVLIYEGYCKQALPFIRGFKKLGCEVTVLCNSKLDCGYASRLPDHRVLGVCDVKRPEESERFVVDLIRTGKFDFVVPLSDFSARILSHRKEELSPYAAICANDKDTFDGANDKLRVMEVCMENGIPCARTLLHASSVEDVRASDLQYPIIIKPRRMYGARGFHKFDTCDELAAYVEAEGIDLSGYVVQECIPDGSKLMGANIYVDRDGEIRSSYLYVCEHIYPESGGTSTLNGILVRDDISEYCNRLAKLMHIRGFACVDLMLDERDDIGKVIEINVRPVHGISVGFFNGVDHARQVAEDALGLPVTPMAIRQPAVASRIGQTDMLWFLSSKDRFRRSARKLGYRVKEQMFFWDDPLPWFAFLLSGIMDYRKIMREKTR